MEWRVFLMFIAYTLYLFIQIYNFNLYNYFTNLIIIQKKKKIVQFLQYTTPIYHWKIRYKFHPISTT